MRRKSNWGYIKVIGDNIEPMVIELNEKGGLKYKLNMKRSHPERWKDYHEQLGSKMCFQNSSIGLKQDPNNLGASGDPSHIPFPPQQCDDIGIIPTNNPKNPSSGHENTLNGIGDPPSGGPPISEGCHCDICGIFDHVSSDTQDDYDNADQMLFWPDQI